MRILLLTIGVPSPVDGGLLAPYHLCRLLGPEHEIDVLCHARDDDRDQDMDAVRGWVASLERVPFAPGRGLGARVSRFLSLWPNLVEYFHTEAFSERLRALVREREPDVVIGFSCNLIRALLEVEGRPRVLVPLDAESLLAENTRRFTPGLLGRGRMAAHVWKYRRMERRWYPQLQAVVVVGRVDRDWLRDEGCGPGVRLIPNGVETAFFEACPEGEADPYPGPAVLFTGTMNTPSSMDAVEVFAREVFPRVRRERPDACFYVVGRKPPARVRALGDLDGVVVTGYVPDVRPYLHHARVFAATFRFGGGMKQKLLESLSAGLSVVASPAAVAGYEPPLSAGLHVAEGAAAQAEAVLRLLEERPSREAVREEAAPFLARYTWEACAEGYRSLLEELGAAP